MIDIQEPQYRRFKLRDIIFAFLFFTWSQIALVCIDTLAHPKSGSDLQNITSETKTIALSIFIIGNIVLLWRAYIILKKSIDRDEDVAPPIKAKQFGAICGVALSMLITTAVFNSLINPGSSENQTLLNEIFKSTPILMTLQIILIAPICEEMCFRYFLLKPGRFWLARFIISGMLFIAVHLTSADTIADILAYTVPVLFLHGIRYITGSVRYSLLLHMLYNGIVAISMVATLYN